MPPKQPVRFLVFGAGAIGSVFAARLAVRHPVAVVARGARLGQIVRDGIRVEGATEAAIRPPAAPLAREFADFRPYSVLVTVTAHSPRAPAPPLAPPAGRGASRCKTVSGTRRRSRQGAFR